LLVVAEGLGDLWDKVYGRCGLRIVWGRGGAERRVEGSVDTVEEKSEFR